MYRPTPVARMGRWVSGAILFAAACSSRPNASSDDGGAGTVSRCNDPAAPVHCGASCTDDTVCGLEAHCGTQGVCTADCLIGSSHCEALQHCVQGRCIDIAQHQDCPDVALSLTPVVPWVMLLIDQSGSMDEAFGRVNGNSVDRWQAVRYALTDPTDGAVTKLGARVRFGATLYHSTGGNAGGTCPILTQSQGKPMGLPVLDNRAAIDQLLAAHDPVQDTPTAESVKAVVGDMKRWASDPDAKQGPLVLIVATDGNPDNCQDSDAHDRTSQQMVEAEVQTAFKAGIQTYALSVGDDVAEPHLERVANAGLGKPLTPADAPFFRGNNPAELVAAFDTIIRGVRTCDLVLDGKVKPEHASSGRVNLDGVELTHGADWVLKDESTVELKGSACQTLLQSDTVAISATFPCGTTID